jgi:hypothetical protein
MIEFRPATQEDAKAFLPGPLPSRVRAYVGVVDGEILGMGWLEPLSVRAAVLWLHMNEEAKKHPFTLHRAAIRMVGLARKLSYRTLITFADTDEPKAERWLTRLGFKKTESGDTAIFAMDLNDG